jgi:hypothetical protein
LKTNWVQRWQIWVVEKAYLGGGYVNICSGIGATLEDKQFVANLVSKLHQHVKANASKVGAVMTNVIQANLEATTLKTQLVGMYQTQRAEE